MAQTAHFGATQLSKVLGAEAYLHIIYYLRVEPIGVWPAAATGRRRRKRWQQDQSAANTDESGLGSVLRRACKLIVVIPDVIDLGGAKSQLHNVCSGLDTRCEIRLAE